jgi:hydroxyacylglutathione hydrolase
MFMHHRFVPGLAIHSYMVGDEKTKECAVIDPTRDIDEYVAIAKAEGLRIAHILETHVHADFVSGARELKARLSGAPQVHSSGLGGKAWTPPYADHVVTEGHEVRMGSIRLRAVHTPGHTPEHIAWALFEESRSKDEPWLMFTGDFLFVGDVGRPDLLGEEAKRALAKQLYGSVFNVLPKYSDFVEVFPAHGAGSLCGKAIGSRASSTVGFERRFNASLQSAPEQVWIDSLMSGMPIYPPYFRRMKKVNAEGPKIIGHERPGQRRFTAEEVHARVCDHCLIVDVRPKEAFASAHIPGAINIPLGQNLPTWAGWVLPYDHPTLLITENAADADEVVTHLLRVGFDDVQGFLEGGVPAWEERGYEISQLESLSVHMLADRLKAPASDRPFVLDVRTEREWDTGHIAGAHHIHGGLLQERIAEVPKDREVAVICGSGYRGSIAASFLKRAGYKRVANTLGGMMAWQGAGLPQIR